MANLLATLNAATNSLGVFAQALAVVQNNVGNATTPGYARQRVFLEASPFVVTGGQSGGVTLDRVESMRDRFLDVQVIAALHNKAYYEFLSQALNKVEPSFPLSGELSVGATVDELFNSFRALAVSPSDLNLRQAVLTAANNVATSIRSSHAGVTDQRATLDQEAIAVVNKVNALAREAADLNYRMTQLGLSSGNSAVETRLTQVLEELAGLVDYRIVRQQDGSPSLVLSGGAPLVTGSTPYTLTANPKASRLEILDHRGIDISANLAGGQLGAILTARNSRIPSYLAQLDQLAGAMADAVNAQLANGRDLGGLVGRPLFQYNSLAYTGAGRTAGTAGASTPAPPVSVALTFSGGLAGSITANLDSFFVASAAPAGLGTGNTITVNFTSADRTVNTSITTAPLTAGDTTATLATRLNDQIALHPVLAGKVTFSDAGGRLKVVLSDTFGKSLQFTASTNNPGFTSGLESGGALGGHSAEEIAAALNAQVLLNPSLSAAGVRFLASGGQVRVDGSVPFTFTGTDNAQGTGFVSGIAGLHTAGGSPAASTFAITNLAVREIAAASPASPGGNDNALAIAALGAQPQVGGFTFNQFFARLISLLGEDTRAAQSAFQTQRQILLEAENIRDSFSGVSLDEEAARLVEFQKSYQATTRLITVIDSLSDEVMRLL